MRMLSLNSGDRSKLPQERSHLCHDLPFLPLSPSCRIHNLVGPPNITSPPRFVCPSNYLERLGVRTRVVSLTDEVLDPNSPMTWLTEKQRRILMSAYKMGYYDVPRRVDSEMVARALKLDKSTVVEHLRKAEKRLLRQVVGF